ncbi:hypothetical protein EVG20_g10863 [Dentipellis fragilis]|uniref:Uncharacterized protein n=1 Tax=Dentipellis fragilis TaxID=205917 RepID=A0A4Y9XNP5_9AGAM|nr:hypothetical protein EVG20_g10863 [Dentipellis fragilis]
MNQKEYGLGRLHIKEAGVYVELNSFVVLFFSGLDQHAGTSHYAPHSIELVESAYRLNIILYPASMVARNDGALSSPGERDQELIHPDRQIQIDVNKFLESFSIKSGPEERYIAEPWSLAPGQYAPPIQGCSPIALTVYHPPGQPLDNQPILEADPRDEILRIHKRRLQHCFDHLTQLKEMPSMIVDPDAMPPVQGPGRRSTAKNLNSYKKNQLLAVESVGSRSQTAKAAQRSTLQTIKGSDRKGKRKADAEVPAHRTRPRTGSETDRTFEDEDADVEIGDEERQKDFHEYDEPDSEEEDAAEDEAEPRWTRLQVGSGPTSGRF